ncbi:MAG: flagellar basal body P-ring formation chaperone FlgA [candidate division FCPU426 bacterium]
MRPAVFIMLLMLFAPAAGSEAAENGLEQPLERWLTERFPESRSRWQVWVLETRPEAVRPADWSQWTVNGEPRPKKIMRFTLAGPAGQTVWVQVRAVRFVRVAAARQVIRRGQTLQTGDWRWEERSAEYAPQDSIREEEALAGQRAVKVLARGEIITRHALEPVPDVLKGQALILRIVGQGVVLNAEAQSLGEGRLGEWIAVKPLASGQTIRAQVLGPELAQIALTPRQP